jgi:hypothetical protein
MQDVRAGVRAVQDWLANLFPDSRIQSHEDFDRDTWVFRVFPVVGRAGELELSREVLERDDPEAIKGALADSDASERMHRDPTVRVQYFSSGVNGFETRLLNCDGRMYRIVRDGSHNIAVFDSADQRLKNTPKIPAVFQGSIFDRPASDWCEQVRAWRGSGQ